jgi:ABC-type nitrate/sulfonate/bicarbonate transport system permease component
MAVTHPDPRTVAADLPAGASPKRWLLAHPGVTRLGIVILLFLIWEISARFFLDRDFISPPSQVVMSLGSLFGTRGVPAALGLTVYEISVGFVLSAAIGAGVGLFVGLSRFAHRSFMPIVLLLYGLPQITILPIFVLLFGIGPASKIAFGTSHGMFPIMIAVAAGVQKINPVLLTSARSMGASRAQVLRHVIFPHMVPSFFAGLRLGMTGVLLGVLLAELYVSTAGIGYFTSIFTQNLQPSKLIGLVSMLALIAVVLNEIVRRAELHYGRWRA